jgi:hypothetical protein
MPSGVVLVPIDIVDRMQNDVQLAAVLADAMANSLEKRDYREQPAMHAIEATEWAADGTGFVVPGLDLMWLGGSIARFQHRTTQPGAKRASQPWAVAGCAVRPLAGAACLVALSLRQTQRPDKPHHP